MENSSLAKSNDKDKTPIQIGCPKKTTVLPPGVYTGIGSTITRIYNPSTSTARIKIYRVLGDVDDIGEAYPPGYIQYVTIKNDWVIEVLNNNIEITTYY